MKLTSKELKRQAREHLNNRYGIPMTAFIVTQLIVLAVDFPFSSALQNNPSTTQMLIYTLASLIISLLSIVLSCGLVYMHLNLARGKEVKFNDLFFFFKERPDRFILSGLMLAGIMLVLMLPAIVITIATTALDNWLAITIVAWIITLAIVLVASYTYGLIYFLLIDNPDMGYIEIFKESRRLMKGNKGRMFYIGLSFIGFNLLALLSFGLGLLWVAPYMSQTNVELYLDIIGEDPSHISEPQILPEFQ